MKPSKIINGFCYLDDNDMIFVSLYNERKKEYEKELFKSVIEDYKLTEEHIVLANEEGGVVSSLFKHIHKKGIRIKNMEFEDLIKVVYDLCIEITKKS
jgi:hypothetical protein